MYLKLLLQILKTEVGTKNERSYT